MKNILLSLSLLSLLLLLFLIEIYYSFFTDLLNDFSLLSPVRRILKMDTIE